MIRFKMAFVMLFKNVYLNCFVAIQLAITIFLTSSVLVFLYDSNANFKQAENLLASDFFSYTNLDRDCFDEKNDIIVEYASKIEVSQVSNIGGFQVNGKTTRVLAYAQATIKYINMPLVDGQWFGADNKPDIGTIDVVVSKGLAEVGDTISADTPNTMYRVVGVLESNGSYVSGSKSLNNLYDLTNPIGQENILIMSDKNVSNTNALSWRGNGFVVFKQGVTDAEKTEILERFFNICKVQNKEDFVASTELEKEESVGVYLPLMYMGLAISLLNFVLITILTIYSNIKNIGVLFLAGGKTLDMQIIMFIYSTIIAVVGTLISMVVSKLGVSLAGIASVGGNVSLLIALVVAVVYLVSVQLFTFIKLQNSNTLSLAKH